MATPIASNVEVRHIDNNKGRGLFSKTSFEKGQVIFEEKPIVSAQFTWNELYKYRACEFCMGPLETAEENSRRLTDNAALTLPVPQCCEVNPEQFVSCPNCQVAYCCTECQQTAWSAYHQVLCMGPSSQDPDHPLSKLQDTWRNIHYPPETSTIMLVVKMVAMVKQATDKSDMIRRFSQFVSTTVNEEQQIVHKLLGPQFQEQLELLRSQMKNAVYEDDVQQWFTPNGFRSLFALIGTNGQGIGSSSISRWVKNCEALDLSSEEKEKLDLFIDHLYEDLDRVSGAFLNCEGSGLYELQSTCNHSCVPNAEISFPHNNHTMTLVALEHITVDEEICISYLDECERERSRHSRHKLLRENYLFTCSCSKCLSQADDQDVTSEEEMESDSSDNEEVS